MYERYVPWTSKLPQLYIDPYVPLDYLGFMSHTNAIYFHRVAKGISVNEEQQHCLNTTDKHRLLVVFMLANSKELVVIGKQLCICI